MIEASESRGQRELMASTQLPTEVRGDKTKLESAGVVFGDPCQSDPSEWWFENEVERKRWEWMRANLQTLCGKQLACFCPLDRPCHADVLAELSNAT